MRCKVQVRRKKKKKERRDGVEETEALHLSTCLFVKGHSVVRITRGQMRARSHDMQQKKKV